jgi:hypothetical protein
VVQDPQIGDRLISLPGRSPVLDVDQLAVLRGYGSERAVTAGDVLFADGDETYDLIVMYLETSRPGIFAVGDVRSGSVKRVAAAIGEGSVAVRLAFERLQSEGARTWSSGLQPGQQVGVDNVGVSGGPAVRVAVVGLERPVLDQLRRQWSGVGVGHDLVVVAVHNGGSRAVDVGDRADGTLWHALRICRF